MRIAGKDSKSQGQGAVWCFRFALIVMVCPLAASPLSGTSNRTRLVPYEEFRQSILKQKADSYLGKDGYRVRDVESFEEMRRYVVAFYDGIQAIKSFLDGDRVVDCIPIDQQPSLRRVGMEHHVLQRVPPRQYHLAMMCSVLAMSQRATICRRWIHWATR